ncbi:structural maintenance of chromosomes protein 5 [Pseudoscourfieldia marina]
MASGARSSKHARDAALASLLPGGGVGSSKRARLEGGGGDYAGLDERSSARKGTVLRVEMRNFMTYAHVVVEPGLRLNLILGPNGTGKSSLVCALCVGLAGHTKLLGRADKISDYVKRGEEFGSVKITLASGEGEAPVTVFRKIKRDNSSEWKVNGSPCSKEKVEKLTKEYAVQLDNLCAFLPQDRVVMFAHLKPVELLVETQKAIGDTTLYDSHQNLIQLRDGLRGLETKVEKHANLLDTKKEQNKSVERDVTKFKEREELRANAAKMATKLPWLKYEEAKAEYIETKDKAKQGKEALKAQKAALDKAQEPVKALEDDKVEGKKKLQKIDKDAAKAAHDITTFTDKVNSLAAKHDQQMSTIESLHDQWAQSEKEKNDLREKIAKIEAEYATAPKEAPPELLAQRDELHDKYKKADLEQREIQHKEYELIERSEGIRKPLESIKDKLKKLTSVRSARLNALYAKQPQLRQVVDWIEANRATFKKRVYGPILCEVDVPNSQHAKMLEQHAPGFLWGSFVTTDEEDRNRIISANNVQKLSVLNYMDDPTKEIQYRSGKAANFAHLGVTNTLDAVFEAAPIIKHVLCDHARLNDTYLVKSNDDVERIFKETNINVLWTNDSQHMQHKSRYNKNAVSIRVVPLRPCRLFQTQGNASTNKAEKDALTSQMQKHEQELQKLEKERETLQSKQTKIESERIKPLSDAKNKIAKEISDINKRAVKMKVALDRWREELSQLEKAEPLNVRMSKERKMLDNLLASRVKAVTSVTEAIQRRREVMHKECMLRLELAELEVREDALKTELAEYQKEYNDATQLSEQLNQIMVIARQKLADTKATAEQETGSITPELEEYFSTLSANYDELEAQVQAARERADRILCPNPNILDDYNRRCAEINQLEKTLHGDREELATGQAKIDSEKEAWLPRLRELVSSVNSGFGKAFASIGCAGEVRLVEAGEEYDRYSIEIRVKFRDEEELQVLCATRQSGGERSVSTILYLLALTSLTNGLGFRVCDEINQGMDPNNERKVFGLLVQSMTRPGTPQSFLLTPKLLPDLEYTDEVTVLNIFNGPYVKQVADGWSQEAFWRRRAMTGAAGAADPIAVL